MDAVAMFGGLTLLSNVEGWMPHLALTGLEFSTVAENLVVYAVIVLITTIVTSWVSVKILSGDMRSLIKRFGELEKSVTKLSMDIERIRTERTQCELRAAHTYSTRLEFNNLLGQQAANQQHLDERMDGLHSKVNKVAEGMALIRGRLGIPPSEEKT